MLKMPFNQIWLKTSASDAFRYFLNQLEKKRERERMKKNDNFCAVCVDWKATEVEQVTISIF